MAKKKTYEQSKKSHPKATRRKKKQTRGRTTQRKSASGRLVLTLKDEKGQPITARTKVVIKETEAAGSTEYRADGKAGEVTRFTFELARGSYFAEVRTEGFKLYNKWVSVAGGRDFVYEFMLTLKEEGLRVEQEKEKGDEGHLLDGRFNWFALQRLSSEQRLATERRGSSKQRDSLREREYLTEIFPSDARQKALEQKKRMSSHEVVHESGEIKVEEIENPLPRTSFGNIDRFVQVRSATRRQSFQRALLKIPFTEKDLGWVNPATLRIFEVNVKKRKYQLVKKSGVDAGRQYAYAYIERPGIYGIIGLPKHPAVLDTVRLFCSRHADLSEGRRSGNIDLQRRICQVILCAPDFEGSAVVKKHGLPEIPGRGGGFNICEFCLGLEPPDGGLPECELLDEPAGPIDLTGCNWLSIGPRNINGRIRAMAIHPTTGNTVYAGSANGGVWVTNDAGQSWKPLMHNEGALEIGALCAHLTDPLNPMGDVTIYAGTGEPTSWPGYRGVGVLKSTDSGATWNTTGTMANDRFASVLVDPTTVTSNPATTTVYAGGPGGLFKSTDGGGTWALMLAKNITGLAMDPTNTAVLYSAVAFEGIYKYDPIGNTWNLFNTGLTGGFPLLILVAIGQAAPHTLYAKLDQTVFKYDTAMSSWTSLGNHGSTTYGYWNNVLVVDPQDSNILIAGGIFLERSFDGGVTWQTIGGLHGDQHAAVFDSSNHLNIYAGNDGGVYRGTYASASAVGTWVKVSDGLILTHFNHVGVAMTGIDVLGGGTQDNGTNRTVGGLTWDPILGADGGFFVVDPGNPYNLYAETQNGVIYKSTNGGASFAGASTGFPGGPWVTPIVLDPTSPAEPNRVLFAGGNSQVYRTTNSAGSWASSSPNVGGSVIAIALSPTSSAIVYAGTSGGKVWRSSDNGATLANWKDISVGTIAGTATLPPRVVTDIVVHPTNPDIVFVAFSGFQTSTPATPGHVFRGTSTDGWATWRWDNITLTLPDIPVNAIQVHPTTPNTLYVGTDIGVFRTIDGGLSWADFGAGLPNVVISDLAINGAGDTLRAATYGYGMFEIDLMATCPAVDLYIRDNKLDTGETMPSPSGVIDPTTVGQNVYWWESADIKVDAFPYFATDALFDGVEFDLTAPEDPIRNDAGHPNPNRLYVQVHNRGPMATNNVKVKALWADASAGLPALPADFWASYPNDWSAASAWSTVDATVPFQTIPTPLLPHTPKVLMWNWNVPPAAADHTCMFVVVSSDEDPVTHSDGNPNDHLIWMLVPNDKRITLRNLHVITAAAPPGGGSPAPFTATLDFHNPYPFPQFFDIVFDRSLLPRNTSLSLLLPKVVTRTPLARKPEKGIDIVSVTDREWWWRGAKRLAKRGWHHHCRVEAGLEDLTCNPRVAHIPGVLIPAGEKVRTAVIVSPPPKARPGSSFRFAVQQRQDGIIIGGSTYEIRIAPVEVKGGK